MVKPAGRYRHQMPAVFHSRLRLKIGLVGGSFNPAHGGHIHVALKARQQLGLDQIWWLVSPQNPLKSSLGMASHEKRVANARELVTPYPFLRVIEPESGLPSNYTYNTLKYMIKTLHKYLELVQKIFNYQKHLFLIILVIFMICCRIL